MPVVQLVDLVARARLALREEPELRERRAWRAPLEVVEALVCLVPPAAQAQSVLPAVLVIRE